MHISWVTQTEESILFLQALAYHDNLLLLFTNKNLQQIITYLWDRSRPYFIYRVFVPFLVLGYIPVHLVAIADIFATWPAAARATQLVGSLLLALYFLHKAVTECCEMVQKGCGYFREWWNYVELLVQTLILTFFALSVRVELTDDEDAKKTLTEWLRIVNIGQILLMNFQLFDVIRKFDFFAAFVRSLVEILTDMAPIGSVLIFVTVAQGMLFFILDMNQDDPTFQGKGLPGLGNLFVDSYRLPLGDFTITSYFE